MIEEKRSSYQKVKAMDALYQDWAKRCFVTKKKKEDRQEHALSRGRETA